MRVVAVVAASRNGVIGRDGGLPWHLSSDLKLFKRLTLGKPVIMGRKTWDGLPLKPLPGRRNIVVTRNPAFAAPGAERAGSVSAALASCAGEPEAAIIGGGQILAEAMARLDRIYLTEVDLEVDGDTYLPPLDPAQWREAAREAFAPGPRDDAGFTLITLDRVGDIG